MNADLPRALDRSAPLNALKPSRVSRRKNCFKGGDNAKHYRNEKTYTAASPRRSWTYLEKGVRPWATPVER